MPTGGIIVAHASAPGRSVRAIVRVSGDGCLDALCAAIDPVPDERGARTARLKLGDYVLPVGLLVFRTPHSYTGEDSAEILLPGNPLLIERVVDVLTDLDGVRRAHPGEFSARAYLSGRLTLDEAEGVAQLIAADRDDDVRAAESLLSGAAGERCRGWSDEIATLLALVEAGIDFTDQEDVVPIAPRDLGARIDAVCAQIADRLGSAHGSESREGIPLVVLVGEPNAGKSTLFNALLGRTRVVVSETAGSTRDAVDEELDLQDAGPGRVMLCDLPGLDARAGGAADRAAQAGARDAIARADLLIHCNPAGWFAPLPPEGVEKPTIRVRTKADLPMREAGDDSGDVSVCALDGRRLDTLRRAIAERALGCGSPLPARRVHALRATLAGLQEARGSFDDSARSLGDPELTASGLRSTLDAIGELTGRMHPDEVIGRVFATFCVGK